MLKKDKKEAPGNGTMDDLINGVREIATQQQAIIQANQEHSERLEDLERKRDNSGKAQVIAAEMVYNTPRDRKRAFTNISSRMVDPLSLADTCAAILTNEVQTGERSLGQIRRESLYDHLGSVKGFRVTKGAELAMQQEAGKAEGVYEEADLGKGL